MKISAIIPAYNEEKTILNVIQTLDGIDIIDEIIVVSDGSTDSTVELVSKNSQHNLSIIELPHNLGKGAAMTVGLKNTNADILLFLDADLIGLTAEHIYRLLQPVINNEAEMTRGIFSDGRKISDLSHKIAPGISGQRAVKREILEAIPNLEKTRFGVEVALNRYIKKNNLRLKEVRLHNLTHLIKEEKQGLRRGFINRMKMYWDIFKFLGTPNRLNKK